MRLITTNQGSFNVNVPADYTTFNRNDNVDWIDYQLATKGEFSPIHSWIVENFVTEDSTVVDVGAHIGTFTIPASKKAKRVYSFEPVIETFQRLTDHILINDSTNIIPFNFAFCDFSLLLPQIPKEPFILTVTNIYLQMVIVCCS